MVGSSPHSGKKKSGPTRSKVKSGCRTCKLRKVKCDEFWPACRRCVSTGRVCDGYGIWGGGGNTYGERYSDKTLLGSATKTHFTGLQLRSPAPMGVATAEEQGYFEWFICRTSRKLPGPFESPFWYKLVLQASADDAAIFHAVIALSCVHKNDDSEPVSFSGGAKARGPNPQEQFTLRQYSKAIRLLNDRISAKDKSAVQVVLISCVVFTFMEFIRGNYTPGNIHLQNGLKLLRELNPSPCSTEDSTLTRNFPGGSFDYDILDIFAKLCIQTGLLGQGSQGIIVSPPTSEVVLPIPNFRSVNQARSRLDWLLQNILDLMDQCRRNQEIGDIYCHSRLLDRQQQIQIELTSWINTYETSRAILQTRFTILESLAYTMMRKFHTMAEIMADTCLISLAESTFDDYIDKFMSIITESIEGRKSASSPLIKNIISEKDGGMSKSIADIAWIPPVYYTALNCRVHRLRLQAVKLLSDTSHKEGIWNGRMAAIVAREVMKIEEGEFYREFEMFDDFSAMDFPTKHDLFLPPLPDSYRIRDVQVVLPDDVTGNILLTYQQRQDDGSLKTLTREFDVGSQRWRNKRRTTCKSSRI